MKISLFLKSIRFKDWIHILGLPILGIIYATQISDFSFFDFAICLFISSLYLAHGYSLNDYFDLKSKKKSNSNLLHKLFLISGLIFILNIIISFTYSLSICMLVITGTLLNVIYSTPPLRAKRFISSNLILNSVGFSLLFMIGFISINKNITVSSIIMTIFFAIFFIPIQIIHQVSHYQEDKEQNISTLYSKYGIKSTEYFIIGFLFCLTIFSLLIIIFIQESIAFFIITLLFSLIFSSTIYKFSKVLLYSSKKANKLRLIVRKMSVIYGLILGLIFLF